MSGEMADGQDPSVRSRDRILDRIKKCMALSASSNEHEAAAALRQARKLMEQYGLTDTDVLAAQADEAHAKAGAARRPPNWETTLACRVAEAFGCEMVFHPGGFSLQVQRNLPGLWTFVGCGVAPKVAQYAFAVLLRQAKRARAEHIRTRLKRCKSASRTRRADLFCAGWVHTVVATIVAFCGGEPQSSAIAAYMQARYPSLRNLKSTDRNAGRRLSDRECDDWMAGRTAGGQAQLNRGVSGAGQPLLG